jgi:Ca2+-binding EF-hand superfamily protein
VEFIVVTDMTKISAAFRSWAGIDKSLIAGEFSAALKAADTSKDGKLSKTEFSAVATKLGLSASEVDVFFTNAAGASDKIGISDLLTKAETANATDGAWTETEFNAVLSTLLTPPATEQTSIFMDFAGADAAMQRSELLAVVQQGDANNDGKINKAEFEKIAEDMGVNTANLSVASEAFSDLAGADNSATINDVMAYFAAFANFGGTYDEAAFNSIVRSLGGTEALIIPEDAEEETSTEELPPVYCGETKDPGPKNTPPARPEPAPEAPSQNAKFTNISGADELIQRSEASAALALADADSDGMLTKTEFKSFAVELGVPETAVANIEAIFDILSNGEASITIDQALAYLSAFNGVDSEWNETEFDAIVTRLEVGATTPFSALATNDVITTAAITTLFTTSDENMDSKLSRDEFANLAAKLGIDTVLPDKFAEIANGKLISLTELTGFANPLGTTANGTTTWTEQQFNAVLNNIRGE